MLNILNWGFFFKTQRCQLSISNCVNELRGPSNVDSLHAQFQNVSLDNDISCSSPIQEEMKKARRMIGLSSRIFLFN